jgi:hypothetical protein
MAHLCREQWSDFVARRVARAVDVVLEVGAVGDQRRLMGVYEVSLSGERFEIIPIIRFVGEPYGEVMWEITGLPSRWVALLKSNGCFLEEGRYLRLAAGAVH